MSPGKSRSRPNCSMWRAFIVGAVLIPGCAEGKWVSTPDGLRRAHTHQMRVVSEPPGARIEIDNETVGYAPLSIPLRGDKDRRWYDIDYSLIIMAFPQYPGLWTQCKILSRGDRIPEKMVFDNRLGPRVHQIDVDADVRLHED